MPCTFQSAHSVAWLDTNHSILDLLVKFEEFDQELPFLASPNDCESHGRDLFNRAVTGEFGPIAPYVARVPTPDQIIAEFTAATQQRLDDFARTRNYDNILSACTYATSTVPKFAGEGQYCVDARDATWSACYAILADVQAGTRPMPTLEEVLAELPQLTWTN